MTYTSAQPGSAQPGARRPEWADGRVRRVRAALVVLFPETPERGTPSPCAAQGRATRIAARSGGRRAVYAAIQVAAVCAGTVVLLLRIAGVPAWDSLYAEDQGVYLFDALAHPWHLLVPYGGYEELAPRLVGQLVSYLPLADVAVPFALAGAGIAALCALFIYHAMDGWIGSPWLRALAGAAPILLPLAPIETADCTVGCPWYAADRAVLRPAVAARRRPGRDDGRGARRVRRRLLGDPRPHLRAAGAPAGGRAAPGGASRR